jgi:hypothetical protein
MIDRELYLPERWTEDPERCKAARVPKEIGFRTKPELAQLMLERALDAGVPASWTTADEVYGGSPALREWLEERQVPHVLAVKCTEPLEAGGPKGLVRTSAAQLAAAVPAEQWIACSAGHGAKGRRLYDWTRIQLEGAEGLIGGLAFGEFAVLVGTAGTGSANLGAGDQVDRGVEGPVAAAVDPLREIGAAGGVDGAVPV